MTRKQYAPRSTIKDQGRGLETGVFRFRTRDEARLLAVVRHARSRIHPARKSSRNSAARAGGGARFEHLNHRHGIGKKRPICEAIGSRYAHLAGAQPDSEGAPTLATSARGDRRLTRLVQSTIAAPPLLTNSQNVEQPSERSFDRMKIAVVYNRQQGNVINLFGFQIESSSASRRSVG